MGIFNEQSFDHPFARGIQGAPGVGFSLTADGNYDMNKKKLTNVGAPSANNDAATKKYVDDNSSGSSSTSRLTVDSNIDMKDTYRITNLKTPQDSKDPATKYYVDNTFLDTDGSYPMKGNLNMNNNKIVGLNTPTSNIDAATKNYVDTTVSISSTLSSATTKQELAGYLKKDGSVSMTGNLNMSNNQIYNLPVPTGPRQPTPLAYSDLKYLHVSGTNKMTNNLNMDNKKIINLRQPTSNTDAATKKYVDDNTVSPDLRDYLKKDGSVSMTGNLNINNNKIINLSKPTSDTDATTKDYVDKIVHHNAVQPSHYNDQFSYLMSGALQWTDEIDGGNSFNVTKVGDLAPNKGNFHDYNHKVLYLTIIKNAQGGYKFKMGINFYRLVANTDYTLCLELLNTDYQLWHKSQISVDKGTSTGLTIGNESIKKLSHRYTDSKGQSQIMYYHRIIVNFRKLSTGNKFFLHILVNIPQDGTDLAVYPRQFVGVYMIAYGIVGTFSNIDPDKVYDYHTAFDIKPTEVVYNVDINANNKKILNIALDKNNNNSAATVGMVKEIHPFTTKNIFRQYFEEFYDFTNASKYRLTRGSSGVVINGVFPSFANLINNIDIPLRHLRDIRKDGLDIFNYVISIPIPSYISDYTLCFVFYHCRNRSFSLTKKNSSILLKLNYSKNNHKLTLTSGSTSQNITLPISFNGKKIAIWLVEKSSSNITKVNISNYSSIISIPVVQRYNQEYFEFTSEGGVINKIMLSKNFYDFDSEQYHKIMIQEKLNGSYIV